MKYYNLLPFLFLISSCSSFLIDVDKIEEILAFDYEKLDSTPEDAIKFQCANNESFFLKYLEDNNAVWVILKDREFRLDRIESENKAYANNTSTIDIKGNNAVIKVDTSILYKKCQNINEEESIDDDIKASKEINNSDLIQNDSPNQNQDIDIDIDIDIDQNNPTKSSWIKKLKFWEEKTINYE